MKTGKTYALALGILLSAGCSSEPGEEPAADRLDQSIVRPTMNGGRNEVVMIFALAVVNGQVVERTCSGSYFAPRVVVTAAHCLENVYFGQLFAYYGDDFATDVSQLTTIGGVLVPPPPGQPSKFAKADSFETHPAWDPELIHPDIGVVYLDRKLPFDPLPLARFRLDNSWLNREVTISGWGANQATGPISAIGGQVQRTGRTRLLGSPTAADYHPEDPNPGMLDPTVRQNVIKTDGRPPYSNGCFGDSGGPILVNQFGQTYIAGVDYFGGLYCEDYSLWVRIDPFLPFFDEAYRKGGQARLVPTFQCVAPNPNGTYRAYFGYDNENGVSVTVPYGSKNSLALDTAGLRPSRFFPGDHPFVFGVNFAANQTVTYTLSPDNNPTTTLRVTRTSRACTADEAIEIECEGYCRATVKSGCPNVDSMTECMAECVEIGEIVREFIPECLDEQTAANLCYANTPPGGSNWQCFPEDGVAFPPACGDELDAFNLCLFGG